MEIRAEGLEKTSVQTDTGGPKQLVDAFGQNLKRGFSTHEEELAAYGRMIYGLAGYFGQDGLADSPQAKDFVNRFFYHHRESASVPIEFFEETRKRLRNEVLNPAGVRALGRQWGNELALIRDLTQGELARVTQSLNAERQDRAKLEQLASGAGEGEKDGFDIPVQDKQARMDQMQREAVDYLSQEPELKADVEERDRFVLVTDGLLSEGAPDPEDLRGRLAEFESFLAKQDGGSYADELYLRALAGQSDRVERTLTQLKEEAGDQKFIWRRWVEKGYVPVGLIDSFEDVINLVEVRDCAELLKDAPGATKAKYLLPFVKKGVSPGLLLEIAEAKYEFPPDFVAKQIDALVHFYDEYEKYEKQKVPWSTRRKLAAVVLAGMIIASPMILKEFTPPSLQVPQTVAELLQQIPGQDLTDLGQSVEQSDNNLGQSSGKNGEGNSLLTDSDSFRPDNTSIEDFEKAKKQTVWRLTELSQPDKRSGYYRGQTASFFNPQKKEWIGSKNTQKSQSVFAKNGDVRLIGNYFKIRGDQMLVSIPVKDGFAPVDHSAHLVSYLGNYNIAFRQDVNGSYYLLLTGLDIGQQVRIEFDIGKADYVKSAPGSSELQNMQTQLIGIDRLPLDARKLIEDLNARHNLTLGQKAKVLEKYVQTNFLYSLNPKWSDYYHDTTDGQEFFRRILDVKKADCDVANSALVALLRGAGIPSRMVYGYAHAGVLSGQKDELKAVEGHGWAEAYIDGKWVTLDGTPSRPEDKKTADAIKDIHSGVSAPSSGNSGSKSGGSSGDFLTTGDLESLKNWVIHSEAARYLLLAEAVNLLVGVATRPAFRKRNQKLADELSKEVRDRANSYFGPDFKNLTGHVYDLQMRRIGDYTTEGSGTNPFLVIPPFGMIRAASDTGKYEALQKFPYSKENDLPQVEQAAEPNMYDFLTKVLGYDEADVQRDLFMASYRETVNRIDDAIGGRIRLMLYGDSSASDYDASFRERFYRRMTWELEKLDKQVAKNELEDLEASKPEIIDRFWAQYNSSRKRFIRRARVADKLVGKLVARHAYSIPLGLALSKENFARVMGDVLAYKAVEWQAGREFDAALKSLT